MKFVIINAIKIALSIYGIIFVNLEEDVCHFDEYLTSIMPLLSDSAELVLKSYVTLIMSMSRKAMEKGARINGNHKDNMLNAMSVFMEVSMNTLNDTYDKLVFMYRFMLNVPAEEYPAAKLAEVIQRNNSVVERILKL